MDRTNKGMLLLNKCLISPWMNGEKRIPRSPWVVLGSTPKWLKSYPNLISNQNTSQMSKTKASGYPMTPGVKTNASFCFKASEF